MSKTTTQNKKILFAMTETKEVKNAPRHDKRAMVHLGIPVEFAANMTNEQQSRLRVLLSKHKVAWGTCNNDPHYGPHAGTSCGKRWLRYYDLGAQAKRALEDDENQRRAHVADMKSAKE
jgi:hypothetical protein